MDVDVLTRRLVEPNGPYSGITVVDSTESTNADLEGVNAPDRTVLIAREQTAGAGRRGREWTSPPGGLYMSVYYEPGVPAVRVPWLTLLAGVALANVADEAGVQSALKWPNDLLLGPKQRKGAGVLAVTKEKGVVLGIGLNVGAVDARLGPGGIEATSLIAEGAHQLDLTELATSLLLELDKWERPWREAEGDPFASGLHEEYRKHCLTLGQDVRVELSGDKELVGTARYLETDGTLVVRDAEGHDHSVPAGDVVHLRAS
ncbi:BirA family biotin operon repressor/biotin-[acetyl-CoA-carboxylase] ligase [Kibdelosporangium banguiense]|uniref:biotin--[biotin carboxyl-carrier protein] ligase n=1 Tax=Kibdelosporangium banguiense TaxID=1365924 RepID=A0ABS4TEG6_9PSEU|nr:biotin--[acetyl-CoA-carboxylase] ligase [Kibdelosporangium banguiense]MBP2322798.1 BirA family biotin operon repressor/biotin-[acetyl-CoA-carboxylase] ligase [Kibdelosporangium banguiense]